MIAAWMLYSLLAGVLVLVSAQALERWCRSRGWPTRWVWFGGLVATFVWSVAALVQVVGAADGSVPALTGGAAAAGAAGTVAGAAGWWAAMAALAGQLASAIRGVLGPPVDGAYAVVAGGAARTTGDVGLLGLWLLATAVLLLVLGSVLLRIRRARTGWRAGWIGDVAVLISERFGPAVVGLLRPAIVTPSWLLERPAEWQRLVVRHEDEHRRARDPQLLALGAVLVTLLPWNLPMWWLLRRARLALELDCDARVLRGGVAPLSYGSLLLDIAGRMPARLFSAPALADSRAHLERRLLAMSEKHSGRAGAQAVAVVLALGLLGAFACGTEAPTAATVRDLDARQATAQAELVGVLEAGSDGSAPLYVLDGEVASEAAVKAIPPAEISSIQVLKGEAAVGPFGVRAADGVVHVITKKAAAAGVEKKLQYVAEQAVVQQREFEAAAAEQANGGVVVRRREAATAEEGVAIRKKEAAAAEFKRQAEAGATAGGELKLRSEAPLFVIDGEVKPASFRLDGLAKESIQSIEVLKAELAVSRYGERGANGVIIITTKGGGR